MKLIFLFLLGLCFLNAQTNSKTMENRKTNNNQINSYLDLFPLHIGNFWQFKVIVDSGFNNEDTTYYAYREILKDSLMPNGKIYVEISDTRDYIFYNNDFLRIDSATGCIYEYSYYENEEYLIDSLKMMTGESIINGYGYILDCIAVDSIDLFGEMNLMKHFSCLIVPVWFDYKFAERIGEIYRFNHFEDIVGVDITSEITYARIDDEEFGQLVNVEDNNSEIITYSLAQNYPNPFNPSTNIGFRIANFGFVTLKIYDVLGNEITTLVNEEKPAGVYEVEFNATGLPSGIYFYQIQAGNSIDTKKLVLLK